MQIQTFDMSQLSIREIMDLAATDVAEPEKRLEKIFDWETTRSMETAKWSLGLSAAVFVAVLVAFFKGDVSSPMVQLPIGFVASVLTGTYGWYKLYRMRRSHRQYVDALTLLKRLQSIAPFIRLYRQRVGG